MKSIIKKLFIVPALMLGLAMFAQPAFAVDTSGGITSGVNAAKGSGTSQSLFGNGTDQGLFRTIANVLLFVIGAISVIMLIIGGIRYTTSNGDQTAVTNAKNTIMYAIIGLVIAILSWALVDFVVGSLTSTAADGNVTT